MTTFRKRNTLTSPDLSPAEKLEITLDMMARGIELFRSGLRAREPDLTSDEIERRVAVFLHADEACDPELVPRHWDHDH